MGEHVTRLLLGLITGLAFGFLLQKGRVAKLQVIIGQFLFKDWTVVKVMGTAVAVGALGVHALAATGATELSIRPFTLGGTLAGAALFGVGMSVLGYCPGTSLAASGEGHRDAWVGALGMFTGAAAFVLAFPWIEGFLSAGDRGKLTLPDVTGLPAWAFVGLLLLLLATAVLAPRLGRGPAKGRLQERPS